MVPGRHLVMVASTGSYMQRSERRHRGGDQLRMDDELQCRQAQNGANLDIDPEFDLEGQGRSLHKTIGTLNPGLKPIRFAHLVQIW